MYVVEDGVPSVAANSVLVKSEALPKDSILIHGYEIGSGSVDYDGLFESYLRTGFQATNFARAISVVNQMIQWQPGQVEIDAGKPRDARCTIFLGYTSNLVSSGVREIIRWLVEHKHVNVIVTTAGGVEEDLIKCLAPTALGDFRLDGANLRKRGLNRIGNLLVPNDNYCKFEDWVMPLFDEALEEQTRKGVNWTPSKLIARLGERIDNKESICYWAARNNIPIFSPALTDGSLGDMLFFHSYKNPGLRLDIIEDIRRINKIAIDAVGTGMIILGGGVVKHHIANANLMRNGANFSVYMNTAHEFDGSDSGAAPDEAKSWGKIRMDAEPVKVTAEATLLFPILVAQTFAKKRNMSRKDTSAEKEGTRKK